MWIVVSVINPLAAFFALSLFAIPLLQSDAYQNTLLTEMASHVGGNWLTIVISIDAFLPENTLPINTAVTTTDKIEWVKTWFPRGIKRISALIALGHLEMRVNIIEEMVLNSY